MEWYYYLLIAIIAIIFLAVVYYIYVAGNIADGLTHFAAALGFDMGTPLECDDTEIYRDGMCYPKCKDPYSEYNAETKRCVYPIPKNWPGGSTSTDIQNDNINYSITNKGIAPTCVSGQVMGGSLCYSVPRSLRMSSPGVVSEPCEILFGVRKFDGIDNGTSCTLNPDTIDRSPYTYKYAPEYQTAYDAMEKELGFKLFDRIGDNVVYTCDLIKYNFNKQGTYLLDEANNTCVRQPQTATKKDIRQISGVSPTQCGNGQELINNMCYPTCNTIANELGKNWERGYTRDSNDINSCYSTCPPNYINNGILGCARPSIDVSQGIKPHACNDKVKKNGLCFRRR